MTGRVAVGEMVVNAAEKADMGLAETHTGRGAATGKEEMVDVAGLAELGAAVAVAVVDFARAVAAVAAVAVLAAAVEEKMAAQKMGRRTADSSMKEGHPVDYRYFL